ncbi:MAG: hypothetical protein KME26_00675 [Oscillatoria princeps RMCB-10]|nr:hypothetical protein [Oscillatoria princeps RMCB-10]
MADLISNGYHWPAAPAIELSHPLLPALPRAGSLRSTHSFQVKAVFKWLWRTPAQDRQDACP